MQKLKLWPGPVCHCWCWLSCCVPVTVLPVCLCWPVLTVSCVMFQLMDLGGMMSMNVLDSSPIQLTTHNNTATAAITPLGTAPNSMLNHAGAMAAMIPPTNGAVPSSTPALLATTPASNSAGTTVTVLASGSQHGHTPTKTIVVVPVSAAGSGDGPTAKKLKSLWGRSGRPLSFQHRVCAWPAMAHCPWGPRPVPHSLLARYPTCPALGSPGPSLHGHMSQT